MAKIGKQEYLFSTTLKQQKNRKLDHFFKLIIGLKNDIYHWLKYEF